MTNHAQTSSSDANIVLDQIQELTWALLDEQITDDEMSLLNNLLLGDDKARETYIGCVQLHTELMAHFANQPAQASVAPTKSPILGFLNAGMPPLGLATPAIDDAAS